MPDDRTASPGAARRFDSRFRARSYELDAFGHVNHAVFLNWFEQARFEALEAGGFTADALMAEGWAVVVARVEVDYRAEVLMGHEVRIGTRVEEARGTSMTLAQRAVREGPAEEGGETVAEARVVAVWMRHGRPTRIPDEIREALGAPPRDGSRPAGAP